MLVVVHQNENLTRVERHEGDIKTELIKYKSVALNKVLFELATEFPECKIAWCLEKVYESIDWVALSTLLHVPMQILSYNPSSTEIFEKVLYYSHFFSTTVNNIPKNVRFQTWMMSEAIGLTHAELLQKYSELSGKFNFQMTLNAIAKLGSSKGVLHYSEPALCHSRYTELKQEDLFNTLCFIKNFQGRRWALYASLLCLYKRKGSFLTLLKALLSKRRHFEIEDCSDLYDELKLLDADEDDTVDVLIPTLGRKECLKDVLDDLTHQTHLPDRVIIVEQHPDENAESGLDYIYNEKWPFEIKHYFIHQLGACNARNIGLQELQSKWMFAADDDIRLEPNMLKETLSFIKTIKVGAVSIATYLPTQSIQSLSSTPYMFDSFASGASLINQKYCRNITFDMAYEFGYGEDTAYGCELRKRGCEVVYYPKNPILHLKAPMGGFRFKFEYPWSKDNIQPKPSPSIMYFNQEHMNEDQIFAYKVFLFFEQVVKYKKINLFSFSKAFKQQWERSVYWANQKRKAV